jgi:CheY-like chemotaxis protein
LALAFLWRRRRCLCDGGGALGFAATTLGDTGVARGAGVAGAGGGGGGDDAGAGTGAAGFVAAGLVGDGDGGADFGALGESHQNNPATATTRDTMTQTIEPPPPPLPSDELRSLAKSGSPLLTSVAGTVGSIPNFSRRAFSSLSRDIVCRVSAQRAPWGSTSQVIADSRAQMNRCPSCLDPLNGEHLLLVADDDMEIRETIRDVLENEGYEVRTAADGVAAMLAMAREKPTLILLDLRMPRLDGRAVLEAIKADPILSDVPVCVVTLTPNEAPHTATCVLRKPFTIDKLLEVVRRHC